MTRPPKGLATTRGPTIVGPLGAPVVALSGVIGALLMRAGRLPVSRVVFNAAAVTLAAAAASWTHHTVRTGETFELYAEPAAALLAALAFGVANVTLVAIAMGLGKRTSFLSAWRNFGIWAVGSSIGSLLIAIGLAGLTASLGIAGLVIGLLGTNLVAASIRAFRDRAPTLEPATAP